MSSSTLPQTSTLLAEPAAQGRVYGEKEGFCTCVEFVLDFI